MAPHALRRLIFLAFTTMNIIVRAYVTVSSTTATTCRRFRDAAAFRRYLTTTILIVGKKNGGEDFIDQGCALYEKRLRPTMTVNTVFLKSDEALVDAALSAKGTVMALDETGNEYTSRAFSDVVFKGLEDGGAALTFVVGGAYGLPPEIKNAAKFQHNFISLSRMTWTHQMARLLLLEQLYRAAEIRKGTSYHKD